VAILTGLSRDPEHSIPGRGFGFHNKFTPRFSALTEAMGGLTESRRDYIFFPVIFVVKKGPN